MDRSALKSPVGLQEGPPKDKRRGERLSLVCNNPILLDKQRVTLIPDRVC